MAGISGRFYSDRINRGLCLFARCSSSNQEEEYEKFFHDFFVFMCLVMYPEKGLTRASAAYMAGISGRLYSDRINRGLCLFAG